MKKNSILFVAVIFFFLSITNIQGQSEPCANPSKVIDEKNLLQRKNPTWKQSFDKAYLLHDEGKIAASLLESKRALPIAERDFGKDSLCVAETLHFMGYLYRVNEKVSLAVPLYQREIGIRRKRDEDKSRLAEALFQLGDTYSSIDKRLEALECYKEGVELTKPLESVFDEYLIHRVWSVAYSYKALKRMDEAEFILLKILEAGKDKWFSDLDYESLANFYAEQKKYDQATIHFEQAVKKMKCCLDAKDPNIAFSLRRFAEMLKDAGKYEDALAKIDEALAIFPPSAEDKDPISLYGIIVEKASVFKRMNNKEETTKYIDFANKLAKRGMQLQPYMGIQMLTYETLK